MTTYEVANIMLSKAIYLTSSAFMGKYDKGGTPYILHCLHVMNQMPSTDPELMVIAVLHDVVEDTTLTLPSLRDQGFSERVLEAVDLLTHRDGVAYKDYINRLSNNPDARLVKMADLRHNSDIMRMKGLRKKDFERLEKYHTAYEYLKD